MALTLEEPAAILNVFRVFPLVLECDVKTLTAGPSKE